MASLGGSWYYIIVGLAFLIAAWLLYRRRSTALWLYAAIVIGTLAWAVWETGFDWWELGPRGGIIVLVALWLLTPWARRGLTGPDGTRAADPGRAGIAGGRRLFDDQRTRRTLPVSSTPTR